MYHLAYYLEKICKIDLFSDRSDKYYKIVNFNSFFVKIIQNRLQKKQVFKQFQKFGGNC